MIVDLTYIFLIVLIQLFSVLINWIIARYHAKLFDQNKSISHALWAAGFCLLFAPTILISWVLYASIVILRLPFFNIMLNYIREKPFFYYGKESFIDRNLGKYYPEIYAACAFLFFVCEIILFNVVK